MVEIAVLMACHNRKEKTLKSLSNLFKQEGLADAYSLKVYLLDDGSTDGTGDAVRALFPQVTVIQGDGTLFWNRGMYRAWEEAAKTGYQFYLWLNDDTDLYPFAINELLSASSMKEHSAIISGCIESPVKKGERVYSGVKKNGSKDIINYPDGNINACDIINGNCVLVPQSVFKVVGNLNWKYAHALGDHDYSLRAKKLGILSFTTARFVASCPPNDGLPKWRSPKVPLADRFRNLYSPLSYSHPMEFFLYEKEHFGFPTAFKHYCSIHLRALFPHLK